MKTLLIALGVSSVLSAILIAAVVGAASLVLVPCLLGFMCFSLGMCI
jgi:hypothetical protein